MKRFTLRIWKKPAMQKHHGLKSFLDHPRPAVRAERRNEFESLIKVFEVCSVVVKLFCSETNAALRAHHPVNRVGVADGPQPSKIGRLARFALLMRRHRPASRAVADASWTMLSHYSTTLAPQFGQKFIHSPRLCSCFAPHSKQMQPHVHRPSSQLASRIWHVRSSGSMRSARRWCSSS